ncbi:MAG: winged helix-turn-helix domain-containing protein [Bryobacteraceae bacterium]
MTDSVSLPEARRIALAAQGFDRPRPPSRVTTAHIRRAIRQLGLLQIDFVNVLVPAHYQVLFSRLGPYQKPLLNDLVYRGGEFTEQWAHEASILPVATWPLLRHRMETHQVRPWGFESFLTGHPEYVSWILEQVRARGPLTADDIPAPDGTPSRIPGDAWVGTVQRAVLEVHFGRGHLAIAARRPNFARAFDLAERILPAEHHGREVKREDAQRELIRLAARSHGLGTAEDLADYYRMPIQEARLRISELVEASELLPIRVEGWKHPAYLDPGARAPRRIQASALLSPFDPLVWYRPRASRLFNFDYRLEIYVPREKRRWGYYVLPYLMGDRLVARVDLKADRAERRLRVLASYLEPAADAEHAAGALAVELRTMATWLELDSVSVERRGTFGRMLAAAV